MLVLQLGQGISRDQVQQGWQMAWTVQPERRVHEGETASDDSRHSALPRLQTMTFNA
jgi:hypothetical protein